MKRIQLSLSAVFVLILLASVVISFARQFALSGARTAFEHLLLLSWLLSLTASFWKSVVGGWKRIFEATVITAAVWSVLVFGAYLMFAEEMTSFGVARWQLLLRAVSLSLMGAASALAGACFLQLMVLIGRHWRCSTMRARMAYAAVSITIPFALLIWWSCVHIAQWQPVVRRSVAEPIVTSRAQAKLLRHGRIEYLEHSRDGRFVANRSWSDTKPIQIRDAASLEIIAELPIPYGQVFQTMTFLPDNSALVAIFNQRGDLSLIRWRTDTWREEDCPSLDDLPGLSRRGNTYPILADNVLLLVYVDDLYPAHAKLEFSTVDLRVSRWTPERFASMTVDLPNPDLRRFFTEMLYSPSDDRSFPSRWTISPNRECIVSAPYAFGGRWLFRRGADRPLKLPGDPLGFLCDGDYIVVREEDHKYVITSADILGSDVPPFWDFPRYDNCYRISILDCLTGDSLTQSGWWRCSPPRLDPTRFIITASYGKKRSLAWDLSEAPQLLTSPGEG